MEAASGRGPESGRHIVGPNGEYLLPPAVVARVLRGEELSRVMDEVTGRTESKKQQGAVGILTNGLFTRAEMWQGPLACALMPFLHPELYPSPVTG
ncbi:DUF84 family protein [Archangium gephyra]|uniref:DUF84 family protein n=1 Tax=Archangium gephyra TaxID=48 RepID=UPI0023EA5AD0|nr:DUF84 family protein [Archangium gephyra]